VFIALFCIIFLPPPPAHDTAAPPVGQGLLVIEASFSHSFRHTTLGRTPLEEWSARRRNLNLTAHNTHNGQTSMPPAGFEPTLPASERSQTDVLDRVASGIGLLYSLPFQKILFVSLGHEVYSGRLDLSPPAERKVCYRWLDGFRVSRRCGLMWRTQCTCVHKVPLACGSERACQHRWPSLRDTAHVYCHLLVFGVVTCALTHYRRSNASDSWKCPCVDSRCYSDALFPLYDAVSLWRE